LEHASIEFEFLAEFFGDKPAREEKKSIYDVNDTNGLLPDDLTKGDGDGTGKKGRRRRAGSAATAGGPLDGAVTSTTTSTTEDDSDESEDEEKRLAKEAATNGGATGESKEIASMSGGEMGRSFSMSSSSFDKGTVAAKKERKRAPGDNPNSTDKIMFSGIFHKTTQLFQEDLESHLVACYDVLGLLILIRINHSLQQHPSRCLENFCHRYSLYLFSSFV
jgi:hypothetical protein